MAYVPSDARQLAGAIRDSRGNAKELIAHGSLLSWSMAVATVIPLPLRHLARFQSRARKPGITAIPCPGAFRVNIDGDRIACFSALSSSSFLCAIAAGRDFCGFFGASMTLEPFSLSSS